jgi:hypothetical protein
LPKPPRVIPLSAPLQKKRGGPKRTGTRTCESSGNHRQAPCERSRAWQSKAGARAADRTVTVRAPIDPQGRAGVRVPVVCGRGDRALPAVYLPGVRSRPSTSARPSPCCRCFSFRERSATTPKSIWKPGCCVCANRGALPAN